MYTAQQEKAFWDLAMDRVIIFFNSNDNKHNKDKLYEKLQYAVTAIMNIDQKNLTNEMTNVAIDVINECIRNVNQELEIINNENKKNNLCLRNDQLKNQRDVSLSGKLKDPKNIDSVRTQINNLLQDSANLVQDHNITQLKDLSTKKKSSRCLIL